MPKLNAPNRPSPQNVALVKEITQDQPAIYAENNSAYYATLFAGNDAENGEAAIFSGNVDVLGQLKVADGGLTVNDQDVMVAIATLQAQVQPLQGANDGIQAQINAINQTIEVLKSEILDLKLSAGL